MTDRTEAIIERTEDAIEHTRDRIAQHANDLQQDLTPSSLLDRLMPPGQSANETISQVAEAARRNPIATALLAGGAFLLGREVLSNRDYSRDTLKDSYTDTAERVGHRVNHLKETAEDAVDRVQDTARVAVDRAHDEAAKAAHYATMAASEGMERSQRLTREARELARDGYDEAASLADLGKRWVEQNPLAASLACLAAGACAASVFTAKPVRREMTYRDEDDHPIDTTQGIAPKQKKAAAKKAKSKSRSPKTGRASPAGKSTVKSAKPAPKSSAVRKVSKVTTPGPAAAAVAEGSAVSSSRSQRPDSSKPTSIPGPTTTRSDA